MAQWVERLWSCHKPGGSEHICTGKSGLASSVFENNLCKTHALVGLLVKGLLDLDLRLSNWLLGNGRSHVRELDYLYRAGKVIYISCPVMDAL